MDVAEQYKNCSFEFSITEVDIVRMRYALKAGRATDRLILKELGIGDDSLGRVNVQIFYMTLNAILKLQIFSTVWQEVILTAKDFLEDIQGLLQRAAKETPRCKSMIMGG